MVESIYHEASTILVAYEIDTTLDTIKILEITID